MWAWKVGSKHWCDWRSDEWPYRCTFHVVAQHWRNGRVVAQYCRNHIPEGLTVKDSSR